MLHGPLNARFCSLRLNQPQMVSSCMYFLKTSEYKVTRAAQTCIAQDVTVLVQGYSWWERFSFILVLPLVPLPLCFLSSLPSSLTLSFPFLLAPPFWCHAFSSLLLPLLFPLLSSLLVFLRPPVVVLGHSLPIPCSSSLGFYLRHNTCCILANFPRSFQKVIFSLGY